MSSVSAICGAHPSLALALLEFAQKHLDFGRAVEGRIDDEMLRHVEPDVIEGDAAHVAHRCGDAGRDDIIVRLLLLQHEPHRSDVISRMAPVALGVDVAEVQLLGEPQLDPRHASRDLARDELLAAQRALVIEEDSGRRVHAEALAIIHGDPVAEELGDGIGRARIEGRLLVLDRLLDEPVHFGGGGLIEAGLRRGDAHRFEHVGDADGGDVRG